MSCCSIPCSDTSRFFSRLASLHRWRFRLFGFEKTQQQLIAGIRAAGIDNASLLEIGCGVGQLHQHLLQQGASTAVGVEISPRMLEEARRQATQSGLNDRTRYLPGDFVELADTLEDADVAILDKVVCCYPEPERLLEATLSRTRRVIALTYPRDRRLTRAGVAVLARIMKWLGSDFRPYVHDPDDIRRWITRRGFVLQPETAFTTSWRTEIYCHPSQQK